MRRVRMQRPMRARVRPFLAAVLDELGRLFVALARRDTQVVRRLRRRSLLGPQARDFRLEVGHLRYQALVRLRDRQDDAKQSFPIQRIWRAM
jgi:hypothetical protein